MAILSRIIEKGFAVTLADDGFDIAPAKKLTDNQRAFLKSHKAEIIQELKGVTNRDPQQQQAGNDTDLSDGGDFHHDFDDRHYCHECRNLINHRCVVQRFKPTDDMPRRCADFYGRFSL